MLHKVTVTSQDSMDELVKKISMELLLRGIQRFEGQLFTLTGNFVKDKIGTMSSIVINLRRPYKREEVEYLLSLRAEIERSIAYFSSKQMSTTVTQGNGFSGVGCGMDYMSLVQPSGMTEHDELKFITGGDCHHMANYLLGCVINYQNLRKVAIKECIAAAALNQGPTLMAYPSPENKSKKVTVEATFHNVKPGDTIWKPADIKELLQETYYRSSFIMKMSEQYRYIVRKA